MLPFQEAKVFFICDSHDKNDMDINFFNLYFIIFKKYAKLT